MNIVIGSDHRGFTQKQYVQEHIKTVHGVTIHWLDIGTHNDERTDYPPYALTACRYVLEGKASFGVLLCGSGIGMAIAANRHRGIYAAVVWNERVAQLARAHDHANIIALPSDFIDNQEAVDIVCAALQTAPLPGRYAQRIKLIDQDL